MARNTPQPDHEAALQWARRMSQPIDRATAHAFDAWVREAPQNWRLFLLAVVKYQLHAEAATSPRADVLPLPVRTATSVR